MVFDQLCDLNGPEMAGRRSNLTQNSKENAVEIHEI